MEDNEEAALYKEYQRLVANIREFEPELERMLILPLSDVPGVLSAKWRIKSWEAFLQKQKRRQEKRRLRLVWKE